VETVEEARREETLKNAVTLNPPDDSTEKTPRHIAAQRSFAAFASEVPVEDPPTRLPAMRALASTGSPPYPPAKVTTDQCYPAEEGNWEESTTAAEKSPQRSRLREPMRH